MDGHGGGDYKGLGKTDGECGGVRNFTWEWKGKHGGVVGLDGKESDERCLGSFALWIRDLFLVCLRSLSLFRVFSFFCSPSLSSCIAFFSSLCISSSA